MDKCKVVYLTAHMHPKPFAPSDYLRGTSAMAADGVMQLPAERGAKIYSLKDSAAALWRKRESEHAAACEEKV